MMPSVDFPEANFTFSKLIITGTGMPPVSLHVETPFIKQ
jgi:hypothetical protein